MLTHPGRSWAVRWDGASVDVAFHVEFDGTGGIATTPTVTADGASVVIGDNRRNLVAVDIPACAALAPGSACSAFAAAPLGEQLGASVVAMPSNRIVFPQPAAGSRAFDVEREAQGRVTLTEAWTLELGGRTVSSVATGLRDVAFVAASDPATGSHQLVAVDVETGRRVGSWVSGDLANVTLASDPSWPLTNNINFVDELAGRHRPAGVWGWRARGAAGPTPERLPTLHRAASHDRPAPRAR